MVLVRRRQAQEAEMKALLPLRATVVHGLRQCVYICTGKLVQHCVCMTHVHSCRLSCKQMKRQQVQNQTVTEGSGVETITNVVNHTNLQE